MLFRFVISLSASSNFLLSSLSSLLGHVPASSSLKRVFFPDQEDENKPESLIFDFQVLELLRVSSAIL